MKSLKQLWLESNQQNINVRFSGWDHSIKFFSLEGLNEETKKFFGKLDTGENIEFDITSDFWELYTEGLENSARAS